MDNVTSVVIPVNEEYVQIKNGGKPKKNVGIQSETQDIKQKIINSNYSAATKNKLIAIYENVGDEVFGNKNVSEILDCSETTSTAHIKRLYKELEIIVPVEGMGKGRYRFKSLS